MGDREKILKKVEETTGVTRKELWEKIRFSRVVSARKILEMALRMSGMTTTSIGNWLKRDHSSVAFNTTHAKSCEEVCAKEILIELGITPQKMISHDEWNRTFKTIKKPVALKKTRKPVFEKKLVPDYQSNICVERWVEKC